MSKLKLKIFGILFLSIVFSAIILSTIYFHNVNICETVVLSVNNAETQCYAISPTGGRVEFERDSGNNDFVIANRYLRDIYIVTSDVNSFAGKLSVGAQYFEIDKNSLSAENGSTYKIKRDVLPHLAVFKQILQINKNLNVNLFETYFKQLLNIVFYYIGFLFVAFLVIYLIKYFKNLYSRDLPSVKNIMNKCLIFLKTEWVKIILVFIISIVFPLLFFLFDKSVTSFLACTLIEYLLAFGAVIFPFTFMAFYAKRFKLNHFFWISLFIIFILFVFVLRPYVYIYGLGFRDDISKFFVKAHTNNFFKCLFTPDAGYLNVLQNIIPYFLLKILGFKNYFPEALQISVAYCFAALFASFNLKRLRVYIQSDLYRFIVSLLFAISPFVFSSSYFLFEIPFVAVAFLLLFYFTYFQKQVDENHRGLFFLIFVSVIMFLSKPIFILLAPIIIALIIYQYFIKKEIVLTRAFVFVVLVLVVQMIVVLLPANQVQVIAPSELGTNYESAFIVDNHGFLGLLPSAFLLFVRQFVKLFGLASVDNNTVNLVINALSFLFVAALVVYYLLKIYKRKNVFVSSFCLSALVVSFMTVTLFVSVVNPIDIDVNNKDFLSMSFYNMISQPVLPAYHRYLILSSFANFIVLLIFVFEIVEKHLKSTKLVNLTKIIFLLLFAGVQLWACKDFVRLHQFDAYEKESYWRSFNSLIFSNQEYYIPYNGFPEQKNCIKSGIDKIIDVNDFNGNTIVISELYPETNNWRISQIILINSDPHDFPIVSGETFGNGDKNAELINGESQNTKALVYKFDNLYKFDKINISYLTPKKKYTGLVRIIGKYEK